MTPKFEGFTGPTFTSTTLPLATTPGKHVYVSDLDTLAVCHKKQWHDILTKKSLGVGSSEVAN